VGVDGSDQSLNAARLAVALARQFNARLLITTVVRPPEGWWGIGGAPPPPEAFASAVVEGRRRILDHAEAELDLDDIGYDTVEEIGDPAGRLADLCESENADLLVVGRRGAGLVERHVVGSVADRVTHIAPCPVLVVPLRSPAATEVAAFTVLDDLVLSLKPQWPRSSQGGFAAGVEEIVDGVHLHPDEAGLEIGQDHACGLGGAGVCRNRPATDLLRSGSEE